MRSLELTLSRRRASAGAAGLSFAAAAAGLWSHRGRSARITITEGNMQPMPIALPDFVGGALPDPAMARGVTQIITSNLQRSGLFAPIDQAAYIEKITNIDQVRFPDWKQINAQALVTGTLSRPPDGRLGARFRLWDVFAAQYLDGKEYSTPPDNWRRIAHLISDAIYERLTGEKGYFDSRVVFIDESARRSAASSAAIMDQDGANVRYLTRGDDWCSRRASRRPARKSPTCPMGRDSRASICSI
jgi:TolB protein